jgi:hypothetical protein
MLNLKTKALYISLFVILILIILNQNSFVFSQSQPTLPVCVSPRGLIVWPDMTTNIIPMASTSDGILRKSYIKFGTTSAYNVYHSIFDTLYIASQLDKDGNVITNPDKNRTNWVIVNRGALYTTGPRNNFNSGGAIGFQDYSTDTTKLYQTIFTIDQRPYKVYDNNGNVSTSSSYGILRFHYGEFNPTKATITSPRLGEIPPGRTIWKANLLNLTWDSGLYIRGSGGTGRYNFASVNLVDDRYNDDRYNRIWNIAHRSNANPQDENKLFFAYYNGSSWSNLLAIDTTGNVGIGTTSPQAKLHVLGGITLQGGENVLKIRRPTTTGGYARGVWFYNPDGSQMEAGIGFRGDGNNPPTRIYLTHGSNGWDSPLGIHILNNGNVGIGTTSPQAKLHIYNTTTGTIVDISSDYDSGLYIKGRGGQGLYNFAYVNLVDGRYNRIWHIAHRSNANPQDENKLFFAYYNGSSWSNLLAIATSGNIGIGTTSPSAKLDVVGNVIIRGTTTASRFCLGNSCITNWPSGGTNYWILSGNSLYATPTTINKLGLGTTSPQATIHINSNDDWIAFRIDKNNSPKWTFGNSSNNSFYIDSQQGGERVLTLTPSGNVGIGTTSPKDKLHIYSTSSWVGLRVESESKAGINIISKNNDGYGYIYFTNLDNGNRWNIVHENQNQNLSFWFHNSSTNSWIRALRLTPLGNIGIGTDNPQAKLHVVGSTIIQGSQKVYSSDGTRLLFEITEE